MTNLNLRKNCVVGYAVCVWEWWCRLYRKQKEDNEKRAHGAKVAKKSNSDEKMEIGNDEQELMNRASKDAEDEKRMEELSRVRNERRQMEKRTERLKRMEEERRESMDEVRDAEERKDERTKQAPALRKLEDVLQEQQDKRPAEEQRAKNETRRNETENKRNEDRQKLAEDKKRQQVHDRLEKQKADRVIFGSKLYAYSLVMLCD